jgi:hypothetical protein
MYLQKAGYSEARHFISKEAADIFEILINGILGLIVIHRDHLGDKSCPLLPWFVASEPNEHAFSGLRDISEDFTLQEAILIVPKLRAKMQAAVRTVLKPSDFKKKASGYSHTYFNKDDIDFGLLGQYPTDLELSAAYEIALEENNCLWSLLGIHPSDIVAAPDPGAALIAQPAPDPDFEALYLNEDEDVDQQSESTAAEQLQRMVDSLKSAANISRAGDEELDACIMASVALAMEDLAKMYVPPIFERLFSVLTRPTARIFQSLTLSDSQKSKRRLRTRCRLNRPLLLHFCRGLQMRHNLLREKRYLRRLLNRSSMSPAAILLRLCSCVGSIKPRRNEWVSEPTRGRKPTRTIKLVLRSHSLTVKSLRRRCRESSTEIKSVDQARALIEQCDGQVPPVLPLLLPPRRATQPTQNLLLVVVPKTP